jgi:hypothetical protein
VSICGDHSVNKNKTMTRLILKRGKTDGKEQKGEKIQV